MNVNWIQDKTAKNEFQLTGHAHEERQEESIELREIREALENCEVLEHYPDDPRGTSCLALGYSGERAIHIVCGRARNQWLLVITVYLPKLPKWMDARTRAK
ncbi:MAG: DUF4258 domain-containing protein [Dehalococcoidia bacterium]